MRYLIFTLSLIWLTVGHTQATTFANLQYLTEEYPPFNYSEQQSVTGISVDLLLAASKAVGHEVNRSDIKVQPWPRAYRSALIRPNTVLFATTRTEAREMLFKWAGPIIQTRIVILAKRSKNIEVNHPMDMAQYRIGVIRDDVGEQLLLGLGVPRDSMVESSVPQTLAKQFAKDRIDVWAYEENVARWWLKKQGLTSEELQVVHILEEGELYYAFNLSVKDEVVKQLQTGIDRVKVERQASGLTTYQTIVSKYF
ncbi:hypothetical protein VISI1226_04325 [Vibrio sinaloensis DSM 21326]|uniref:Solute-binding protein family 3/N-terminal domain-containing protein n=1 Tax=Vibrio sinaloensis DSM 21326 TaxID=945550 RepID=E8M714_PHOS4|nr:transporter substrate-binding domain-containing protein [Vibrio sinaloensis]EGA70213.1 hypothetical protein VISI1226_04325 [Vibrio sinaloensis DSM 21326]